MYPWISFILQYASLKMSVFWVFLSLFLWFIVIYLCFYRTLCALTITWSGVSFLLLGSIGLVQPWSLFGKSNYHFFTTRIITTFLVMIVKQGIIVWSCICLLLNVLVCNLANRCIWNLFLLLLCCFNEMDCLSAACWLMCCTGH